MVSENIVEAFVLHFIPKVGLKKIIALVWLTKSGLYMDCSILINCAFRSISERLDSYTKLYRVPSLLQCKSAFYPRELSHCLATLFNQGNPFIIVYVSIK